MFSTQITSPITANTYMTLSNSPIIQTNSNVSLNDSLNGILIKTPGVYKVKLQLNATSTGTDIGAQIYANGNAISVTSTIVTVASGDDGEVVIEYPLTIKSTTSSGYALIQFMPLYGATLLNGYVTVERVS